MAADWDGEMQEMFDRLQQALTEEIRNQFLTSEARLEERLAGRIDAALAGAEVRIEGRIDERLSHRLRVQTEELREVVRTAAGVVRE